MLSNLHEIAPRLECGKNRCVCHKSTNGNLLRHCPAHDDEHPSLSLKEDKGKVLWNCLAGCGQERVLTALKERGL
jgi:hypothetical protein